MKSTYAKNVCLNNIELRKGKGLKEASTKKTQAQSATGSSGR